MRGLKRVSFNGIHKYLEALSFLVIILGVPTFFYQQWQVAEIRRVEHTLDYVDTFQGDRIARARTELLSPWVKYSRELQFVNKGVGLEKDVLESWVDQLVQVSVENNPERNMQTAIFDMTDFYDQLYICVLSDVCHEKRAVQYFGSNAEQFQSLYGHRVKRLKSELSLARFGQGVVFFAEKAPDREPE